IVVSNVTNAALFGQRHPYGFSELGTEASIKRITREDLAAFWKRTFIANNAALVVTGDVKGDALKSLVERTFGAWPSGTIPRPPAAVPVTTPARLILVDTAGAQQSQVRTATIGAARSTPDYPRMQVLNEIVGGLFSSRINMNLREEHGYTYGAFSRFVYRRRPGPFFIGSGIRTDVTAPAVSEIIKELKRLSVDPITDEELALGRD